MCGKGNERVRVSAVRGGGMRSEPTVTPCVRRGCECGGPSLRRGMYLLQMRSDFFFEKRFFDISYGVALMSLCSVEHFDVITDIP